ncbi:MAG: HNH endonuclease [Candidatus Krumholzibacteriia bacterium]
MSDSIDFADCLRAATPAQQSLHNNFVESIRTTRKGYVRAAFYLAEIADRKIHRVLGYKNLAGYASAAAGLTPDQSRDMVRMGRRLRDLPRIARAIESGSLSWHDARAVVGQATPQTERELTDLAGAFGVKAIEESLPASASPRKAAEAETSPVQPTRPAAPPAGTGDPAADDRAAPTVQAPTPDPEPDHLHVTLKLTPEQYARWEAAIAARRQRGSKQPLGALHVDALESSASPGAVGHTPPADGPGTLLVILSCPGCGRADLVTSRGDLPVPRALLESAACDALVETETGGRIVRRHVVPLRLRRAALRRDRYRCQADGCNHDRQLEIHHRVPASAGGRTELDNLITLCRNCHRLLHRQEQAADEAARLAQSLG